MAQQQGDIPGFAGTDGDPPNRGRGRTFEKALDNAVKRMVEAGQASHGDVLSVTLHVTVSNPNVGEYIADLG